MKSTFTFILVFIFSIATKAQDSYYWYQSEKVYLIQNPLASYINISKLAQSDKSAFIQYTKSQGAKISNMSANELVIETKEPFEIKSTLAKNIYQSLIYKTSQAKDVIIIPSIIIKLMKNKSVDDLLVSYRGKLRLKVEKGYDTYILDCNLGTANDVLKLANELKENNKDVVWCEPEFYGGYTKTTSDPMFPQQYYLKNTGQFGGLYGMDINIELAWLYFSKGNSTLKVAVIDDGVEAHEDLGTLLPGFTAGTNMGTGAPQNGAKTHGTSCAGIIAAKHNTTGIAGIAPNVQIIPVNIFPNPETTFNSSGSATNGEIATAIDWAWNEGQADVLSNSWGSRVPSSAITDAINRARTLGRNSCGVAKGCIIVFASGNSNETFSGVLYPGNLDGVVTVGAINRNGNIQNYSSRGPEMDLVAPSGNINYTGDVRTLDRMGAEGLEAGNYTNLFGGTSAACPQVSGVVALMLSVNPHLTEAQVRNILNSTAIDMGPSGFDNTYGYGRLNAYHALLAASSLGISGPSIICNAETYTIPNLPPGASVTWAVTGNISISGSNTGASVYIVKAGNGKGNIEATISSNCSPTTTYTFSKNEIIVGSPLPTDGGIWISSSGEEPLDQSSYFITDQIIYINLSNPAYSNYNWTDFFKNGDVSWYHQAGSDGLVIEFQNPNYGDYVGFTLSATNSCGLNNSNLFFYYQGGPYYLYKTFPNPSDNLITITPLARENNKDRLPQEIAKKIPNLPSIERFAILDKMGNNIMGNTIAGKSNEVQIDLGNLKSDVYSLILYLDNAKTETHKIIKSQ